MHTSTSKTAHKLSSEPTPPPFFQTFKLAFPPFRKNKRGGQRPELRQEKLRPETISFTSKWHTWIKTSPVSRYDTLNWRGGSSSPNHYSMLHHTRTHTHNLQDTPTSIHHCQIMPLEHVVTTFQLVVASVSNNNVLFFYDKSSSKFQLVVASVANECSKGSSKKTTQCTMNNSRQSRSFIDDVSIDLWQCPMKIDEVNFQQVGNSASTELVGSCHDKKIE